MVISADSAQPITADLLKNAKAGDRESREYMLSSLQPYIIRFASNYCGRFLRYGVDEEISVALLALNEAIDSYKPDQGTNFTTFATIVVKRRLIDFYRRRKSLEREIPFAEFQDDDSEDAPFLHVMESSEAERVFLHSLEESSRKDEILYYAQLLAEYKITLAELADCSPKHEAARKRCIMAARVIYENDEIKQQFLRRKELPLKELENKLPFSRKTLERHRKYIIALLLVCLEDLPHIREYLKGEDWV